VPAIEDALLRVSRLAAAIPEIAEIDLNPLRVGALGSGAGVLAGRISVRAAGG
jgi:hypothetical protein